MKILLFVIVGIVILIFLLRQLKAKGRQVLIDIQRDLLNSGEKQMFPPQASSYNGADRDYPKVKCSGVIAATERQIFFRPIIGAPVTIKIQEIESLTKDKWFNGYFRNNLDHLIFNLKNGNRVAFFVKNIEKWSDGIEFAIKDKDVTS